MFGKFSGGVNPRNFTVYIYWVIFQAMSILTILQNILDNFSGCVNTRNFTEYIG